MALTNAESQRIFKARMYQRIFKAQMYEAGYKQVQVWALRSPGKKQGRMDRSAFIRKVDELTAEMSGSKKAKLYSGLIKSIEAEKGPAGQKRNSGAREGKKLYGGKP